MVKVYDEITGREKKYNVFNKNSYTKYEEEEYMLGVDEDG